MGADEELWKTGKSAKNSEDEKVEEDDTLDLSAPSPDSDSAEEIDLERMDDSIEDDNWLPPAIGEGEGINLRTVGIVGTVTILLLTGALVLILNEQKIVGIQNVDTRSITRHIRDKGAMNGIISAIDSNIDSLKQKLLQPLRSYLF